MAHFTPAHPAHVAAYGAHTFSGAMDAYDPYGDEELRQLEAERDRQALVRTFVGIAGALAGGVVGTRQALSAGTSPEAGLIVGGVMGAAVGYFGTGLYYAAQDSAQGILDYDEYGG